MSAAGRRSAASPPRAQIDDERHGPTLRLAPGVHAACADGGWIFLDVRRDRYFKLGRRSSRDLSARLETDVLAHQAKSVATTLETRGLARVIDSGRRWREPASAAEGKGGGLTGLVGGMGACAWAASALRRWSFERVLVETARMRISKRARQDADAAGELAHRFLRVRPFYPRDYACLFDSLALMRFLLQRQIAADWVFGVRGAPFAAHCWVAAGDFVLNDEADRVAPHATIMIV